MMYDVVSLWTDASEEERPLVEASLAERLGFVPEPNEDGSWRWCANPGAAVHPVRDVARKFPTVAFFLDLDAADWDCGSQFVIRGESVAYIHLPADQDGTDSDAEWLFLPSKIGRETSYAEIVVAAERRRRFQQAREDWVWHT
jgi:hypothetical protein